MKRILNVETVKYLSKKVRVCGWVQKIRSHGKIIFVDLRDRSGLVQIVFVPKSTPESGSPYSLYEMAQKLRPEWVIEVIGKVNKRPKGMENPKIETGKIELRPENLKILSQAKTLPFSVETPGYEISEKIRLKYRYLDLRRPRLRKNLEIRQKVIHFMRDFLIKEGFIEVETPILTKSTPEGARDFLVPSRIQPGKFYALPQSPQQYKQLLMVSGFEKYFQIARCFRDEDPRADRQPEFTQLDLEMSFAEQEDILGLIEKLYITLIKKLFPKKRITKIPFPRIPYKKVIEKYKTDRPDLRRNKNNPDELAFAFIIDFPMFEWRKSEQRWDTVHHPFTRPQTKDYYPPTTLPSQPTHPKIEEIKKHPENILAYQYDFILNGEEIGGGSLRTTDLEILTAVFEVLGHRKQEIRKQFKNYFESFSYGVPPHGGIAQGIDRFLAVILNESNIREVIAFPKTGDNRDLMMGVPAEVNPKQLKELNIKILKKKNSPSPLRRASRRARKK